MAEPTKENSLSLVTLVNTSGPRELLNEAARQLYRPKLEHPILQDWKGDRKLVHPGTMGTAFDYAARIELSRLIANSDAEFHEARWVAEIAVGNMPKRYQRRATRIIFSIKKFCAAYRRARKPQYTILARAALQLAKMDAFYRSEMYAFSDHPTKPLFEVVGVHEHKELCGLLRIFSAGDDAPAATITRLACDGSVVANPTFEVFSQLVGGADADLIIPNWGVIDIKTVRYKPELKDVRQLLGYAALAKACDRFGEIEHVGFYLSRYGRFEILNLPTGPYINDFVEATVGDILRRIASLPPKHRSAFLKQAPPYLRALACRKRRPLTWARAKERQMRHNNELESDLDERHQHDEVDVVSYRNGSKHGVWGFCAMSLARKIEYARDYDDSDELDPLVDGGGEALVPLSMIGEWS